MQISAYPDAYAKHEPLATQIVNALADGAASAVGSSIGHGLRRRPAQIAASGWTVAGRRRGRRLRLPHRRTDPPTTAWT